VRRSRPSSHQGPSKKAAMSGNWAISSTSPPPTHSAPTQAWKTRNNPLAQTQLLHVTSLLFHLCGSQPIPHIKLTWFLWTLLITKLMVEESGLVRLTPQLTSRTSPLLIEHTCRTK